MRAHCPLSVALSEVFVHARSRILRRLRRSFSSTPTEQIEDALSQSLLSLLETTHNPNATTARAWRTGGSAALERLLSTVAWRTIRGEHRLLRARREHCRDVLPDLPHQEHPQAWWEAHRTLRRVQRLVPMAARRFGPTRARELQNALWERCLTDETDGVVAARHGVGRSQLCRARGWLEHEATTG